MFIAFLALRETLLFDPTLTVMEFPRFVFSSGGTLAIEATSSSNVTLFVGLYDSEALPDFEKSRKQKENLCTIANVTASFMAFIQIPNGFASYQFNFSKTAIILAAVSVCESQAIELTAYFHNPGSCLSADYIPSITLKLAIGIAYAIVALVWGIQTFRRRPPLNMTWALITATLSLFILDNFSEFGILIHDSKVDDPTGFIYFRYALRASSVALFFATLVIASLNVIRQPHDPLDMKGFFAAFTIGLFLGIPLALAETHNFPASEIWMRLIEAVWVYICWQMSFAIAFKRMKELITAVEEAKSNPNYKSTGVWHHYIVASYYLNLYAVTLWTSFLWVMLPFPEQLFFWTSQITVDLFFFFEFTCGVVLRLTQNHSFIIEAVVVPNEEMQANLMREELADIE
jgi:hypothetical protein